jgi:hypothetical protein
MVANPGGGSRAALSGPVLFRGSGDDPSRIRLRALPFPRSKGLLPRFFRGASALASQVARNFPKLELEVRGVDGLHLPSIDPRPHEHGRADGLPF